MPGRTECPLPLFSRRPELGDAQLQVKRLVQGVHGEGAGAGGGSKQRGAPKLVFRQEPGGGQEPCCDTVATGSFSGPRGREAVGVRQCKFCPQVGRTSKWPWTAGTVERTNHLLRASTSTSHKSFL